LLKDLVKIALYPTAMEGSSTLGEMAKALNRPAVYLHELQARFDLPVFEAGYTNAYLAFLRTIFFLRTLGTFVR
jgi:hypothetical protein